MKRLWIALALGLATLPAVGQDPCRSGNAEECRKFKEANCRTAVDGGLAQARALPAKPGADAARRDELVRRLQTLVEDNRRKGVDECTTWGQVMGIAFNQ